MCPPFFNRYRKAALGSQLVQLCPPFFSIDPKAALGKQPEQLCPPFFRRKPRAARGNPEPGPGYRIQAGGSIIT